MQACKALKAFSKKEDAELYARDVIAGRHDEEDGLQIILCDVDAELETIS